MTPYETRQLDQQRCEQQDAIAQAYYTTGISDALERQFPRWNLEPYLTGYVAGVKQLPADPAGRIAPERSIPISLDDEF
jgi:hypothetical protein